MEKHKVFFKIFGISLLVVGLISNIIIAIPATDRFVRFEQGLPPTE